MASNTPVTDALKRVLANSYMLYLKTQNFHWNVTGPNFKSLHELFEMQYNELAAAVDLIAEHIRTLHEKAPGTFAAFTKLSEIKDGDEDASAKDMVSQLAKDNRKMCKILKDAIDKADTAEDPASSDMLVDRLRAHEKAAWMLEATAS
ncbi:MAG: DNA starvation/stationary phase protection protein [Pseudomonadota bacterium]